MSCRRKMRQLFLARPKWLSKIAQGREAHLGKENSTKYPGTPKEFSKRCRSRLDNLFEVGNRSFFLIPRVRFATLGYPGQPLRG